VTSSNNETKSLVQGHKRLKPQLRNPRPQADNSYSLFKRVIIQLRSITHYCEVCDLASIFVECDTAKSPY